MERGRRRDSAFSQKGGRKSKNHMTECGSNQEISPTERGGRTYPETRNALSKQSAGGGGEESRKERGTAEGCDSKAVTYHPRTQNKMTQCSAANICC
ncbi:hypothetical protein TNCV_615901 [Trichonephila clavipes]|nr:hypothetical protein TNCV_615901 [Trichonephila clavipes]